MLLNKHKGGRPTRYSEAKRKYLFSLTPMIHELIIAEAKKHNLGKSEFVEQLFRERYGLK